MTYLVAHQGGVGIPPESFAFDTDREAKSWEQRLRARGLLNVVRYFVADEHIERESA